MFVPTQLFTLSLTCLILKKNTLYATFFEALLSPFQGRKNMNYGGKSFFVSFGFLQSRVGSLQVYFEQQMILF